MEKIGLDFKMRLLREEKKNKREIIFEGKLFPSVQDSLHHLTSVIPSISFLIYFSNYCHKLNIRLIFVRRFFYTHLNLLSMEPAFKENTYNKNRFEKINCFF